MMKEMQLLKSFDDDTAWIEQNMEKLREKHLNEFIAVKGKKIVAFDKDFEVVLKKLKKHGIPSPNTIIRFVFEKGYSFILWGEDHGKNSAY